MGSIARDGLIKAWDLHHGGGEHTPDNTPEEVLLTYLYHDKPVAFACAYTGLRLTNARAVTGPPDVWVELPERDYWTY